MIGGGMYTVFRFRSYLSLLFAQLFVIATAILGEDLPFFYLPFLYFFLGSVITSVWDAARLRIFAIAMAILSIIFTIAPYLFTIHDLATRVVGILGTLFMIGCAVIGIFGIGRNVFASEESSGSKIVASIALYLLIGMLFALLYDVLGNIWPSSFNLSDRTAMTTENFSDYVYFSFITLTTTGFGDMVPVAPIARVLSVFEAIVGPLYLAITVARLVGMYISEQITDGGEG